MRFYVIVYVLIVLTACRADSPKDEQLVLEIISQHFSDRIILSELMPVYDPDIWIDGRVTKGIHTWDGKEVEMSPSPPIDTILYGEWRFDRLVRDGVLTTEEARHMRQSLRLINSNLLLSSDNAFGLTIIPGKTVRARNATRSRDKRPGRLAYFQLSIPILNKQRTKVLISVNMHSPPEGIGYIYIFEMKNGKWEIIYQDNIWIT